MGRRENKMKQLIFNDSQRIEVQSVHKSEQSLLIRMIHVSADELKALFKDDFLTRKMTLIEDRKEPDVYEKYTVFSYIKEDFGGIYEVEMIKNGKDPETRLSDIETVTAEIKEQAVKAETDMQKAIAELTLLIATMNGGSVNV